MKRQRTIKKTAYFLIFIFLAHMLSLTANDSYGLLSHAENAKSTHTSVVSSAVHTDALMIHQETRTPSFKVSIQKLQCTFTAKLNNPCFSMQFFSNKGILIDMRQKISCTMSNYFHSAKYKDCSSDGIISSRRSNSDRGAALVKDYIIC